MRKLFTLVAMQLADKIDFSYLKSVRQAILKIVLPCISNIGAIIDVIILVIVIVLGIIFFIYKRFV